MSRFAHRIRAANMESSGIVIKPDATNTGVPLGTNLTIYNGNLNIASPGVYEALDVHGFVTISANNVTFRNSIVRGGTPSANRGIINVNSGTNILIDSVEISPTTPSVYWDGIWGGNYHARKLNIHDVVDGAKLDSNVTIELSYIHDLSYFANDPNQGGGPTHNDGLQILAGNTISVYGNNLEQTSDDNAAIQVTQDYGAVTNLSIEHNWLDGGGATLNIAHKVLSSLSGVLVKDNRFGRNSFYNAPILISTQTSIININNVWDDTGQPVPVQQHD